MSFLATAGVFNTVPTAGGGASGNFTFSVVQSVGNATGNDPVSVTIASDITAGNRLFAVGGMRAARSHTTHAVTDNNGKTWTKIGGTDNEVDPEDTNSRSSMSVWSRIVDGTGETDASPLVTLDDNATDGGSTNLKYLYVFELSNTGGTYGWVSKGYSGAGADNADWDAADPSPLSVSGDDIFVLSVGVGRTGTSGNPTEGGTAFTNYTSNKMFLADTSNDMAFCISMSGTSVASGSIDDTLVSDSTGTEGMVAILAYGDS